MSASPAPTESDAPRDQEQITFRFCREWYAPSFFCASCLSSLEDESDKDSSNMLYPKEDFENNQLMYACRTCQFSEPAVTSCVYRNQLANTVGETAGVTQDVGADPTVSSPSSNAWASGDACYLPGNPSDPLREPFLGAFGCGFPVCMLCGEDLVCGIYNDKKPTDLFNTGLLTPDTSDEDDSEGSCS